MKIPKYFVALSILIFSISKVTSLSEDNTNDHDLIISVETKIAELNNLLVNLKNISVSNKDASKPLVRNTQELDDKTLQNSVSEMNRTISSLDNTYKNFRDTEEAIEKDLTRISSDVQVGHKNFIQDSEKLIDEAVSDAKFTYRRIRKNLYNEYNRYLTSQYRQFSQKSSRSRRDTDMDDLRKQLENIRQEIINLRIEHYEKNQLDYDTYKSLRDDLENNYAQLREKYSNLVGGKQIEVDTSNLDSVRKRMEEINDLVLKLQHETRQQIKETNDPTHRQKLADYEKNEYDKYSNEWHALGKIYDSLRLRG